MKAWSEFYDHYLRDLPGLTVFAAQNELRKAAQEFCKRTGVWRTTLDTMKMFADVDLYDFDIESTREVHKILSAKLDDNPLAVLTRDQFDDLEHGITALSGREFMLYPAPSAGQELVIKAVLYPSASATGVEDFIFAAHAEDIAYGAKARLKRRKGTEYYDPVEADADEARFDRAISRAHFDTAKGRSRAPLRTRASFF